MNAVSRSAIPSAAKPDLLVNADTTQNGVSDELNALLDETIARDASDLHLIANEPPTFRVRGELVRADAPPWTAAALETVVLGALPPAVRFALVDGAQHTVSAIVERNGFAFTLCAFHENGGRLAATVRVMPRDIPTLEQIGGVATEKLKAIAALPRGMVLFTGPTGSGKTTSVCAVVEEINKTRPDRIFLLEGTPGYRFTSKTGLISALYIGQDASDYAQAAQTVWEGADPDVVYFADLATEADLRAALTLADTGHLVLIQLHATSAADALARLVALAHGDDHLRQLLAQTLVAVFNQRLLPRANRPGKVCAHEYLPVTGAVREALRSGGADETALWEAARENENAAGAQTDQEVVTALLESGEITSETADAYRRDRRRSQGVRPNGITEGKGGQEG